MDQGEEYVRRRRRWSGDEKRAIVQEAATSGTVMGTAKRHGIQAQQIYRWRDRLPGPAEASGFVAVSLAVDPPTALPAPVPELTSVPGHPAAVLDGVTMGERIEIAADSGVTVRLPSGSSAALVVAIATGMARRR